MDTQPTTPASETAPEPAQLAPIPTLTQATTTRVLVVAGAGNRLPTLAASSEAQGEMELNSSEPGPVTVITPTAPPAAHPIAHALLNLPATAPKPRLRPWWYVGLTSVVLLVAFFTGIYVDTTPLQRTAVASQVQDGDPALALQTLRDPSLAQSPTGPWQTSAGIATLGYGGGAGPGVDAPGSAGLPVSATPTVGPTPEPTVVPATTPTTARSASPTPTAKPTSGGGSSSGSTVSPAPLHPWPPTNPWISPPGYANFRVTPTSDFYAWAFGQCTWWAQWKRRDENLRFMGNAQYWAGSAKQRGYKVSTTPRAGATVVFQPGVQGAGGAGHVAHVEKVYPGGWFLVSEMNFYWNGGGFGRVDWRFAHAGAGVSFIN